MMAQLLILLPLESKVASQLVSEQIQDGVAQEAISQLERHAILFVGMAKK